MSDADGDKTALLLKLLEKTDGREDDTVLEYTTRTTMLNELADGSKVKTIVYGLKGVGKSTAFKFLTSSDWKEKKVLRLGFSPGASRLNDLVPASSGDYRERLYNLLIMSALSLARAEKVLPKEGVKKYTEQIEEIVGPLEDYLSQIRKRLTGIAGLKFDLSEDQEATIRSFDRGSAGKLIDAISSDGWQIHFVFDDPEMLLGTEGTGADALAGLVQAANQVNTNFGGKLSVTLLLKSHLKPLLDGYEEVSNILPNRIGYLSWEPNDLKQALTKRIQASGAKNEDLIKDFDAVFENSIVPFLRSGPRDLFAWLAIAFAGNNRKALLQSHLEMALPAAAKYSVGQITSGYKDILPDTKDLVVELFDDIEWRCFDEMKQVIAQKRANSPEFQSLDKRNNLDTSQKYIAFLVESGCVQMRKDDVDYSPFEKSYSEFLDSLRNVKFRLHPLLAEHPEFKM